jgi:hypothetical protein
VNQVQRVVIPGAVVSQGLGLPAGTLPDVRIPIDYRTQSDRAAYTLDHGAVGLRLGGTVRDVELDLYHYSGPTTEPDVDLRFAVDAVRLDLADLGATRLRGDAELKQAHHSMHMTGADAATRIGGATVRLEVAWFKDRPFERAPSDLFSPATIASVPIAATLAQLTKTGRATIPLGDLYPQVDCVEWGVGADYAIAGFLPIAQVSQIVLLENAPPLLVADPETRFTGVLRRQFLDERLEAEVRGIYALERESWFVFPRVSYRFRDDLRVRLGYLAIGGQNEALIGQYQRNDEVVVQARYTF